jgi:hypothetical protein
MWMSVWMCRRVRYMWISVWMCRIRAMCNVTLHRVFLGQSKSESACCLCQCAFFFIGLMLQHSIDLGPIFTL